MTTQDREEACHELAADKRRLGLPLDDVRRIDSLLAKEWGITMPLPPQSWGNRLEELAGKALATEYWQLHDEVAMCYATESPVPENLETTFYNVLADDRISGHVHSQKRTEILDAGCLLLHLVRALRIAGPILDVGCHIGYHSHLLAQEAAVNVQGIDLCAHAIGVAQAKTAGSPRLTFNVGSLARLSLSNAFEFIYAVRSIALDKIAARQLYAALKPGGIAAIFTRGAPDSSRRARKAIHEAGLGWGFSDVVGGWAGEDRGYEAGLVLVLIKDGSRLIPADFVDQAQSAWNPYFKDYANAPDTPWSEKTQAYFRAHWLASHAT
jgi:SAM-dependent methyltransferase